MSTYRVKCLDARFDEESDLLVLNCWFAAFDQQRMVVLSRSDFHYKQPGVPVPFNEMHKTAALFKKKEFNIAVMDDPNKKILTNEESVDLAKKFVNTAENEVNQAIEGFKDEDQQIKRKLGKMAEEGKIDIKKLLSSELAIRAKLDGAL